MQNATNAKQRAVAQRMRRGGQATKHKAQAKPIARRARGSGRCPPRRLGQGCKAKRRPSLGDAC
eukprot:11145890-Lingulodinium_polyedra.AAC.1